MLNQKRTIPFDFRVFEMDGIVWLFDESERTYPCTAIPHIYAEPMYFMNGDAESDLPDGNLFLASSIESRESIKVPVKIDREDWGDEREAWNDAWEKANSNCLL